MRILLVGNYKDDRQQSMARYAAWLERALTTRGHRVTLVMPGSFCSKLGTSEVAKKYLGYIDKLLVFHFKLQRMALRYDIIHILDHSNAMYLRAIRDRPSVITCHDTIAIRAARGAFPEHRTRWSGRILQRWILSALGEARHIICVSAQTAKDLNSLPGMTPSASRVIHNALNWDYRPGEPLNEEVVSRFGVVPGTRYLLHVGGNQWYKNRVGAVRIFARLCMRPEFSTLRLVMAGKRPTPLMKSLVQELGLGDRVIEAVNPSSEQLRTLYCNAVALIFPSFAEGFGWPILEAHACGCPVITTNRPPMTEIGGNAAIFIDLGNPDSAADEIARRLVFSGELRKAGFQNLLRFTEDKIVEQYCSFYREICSKVE